MRQLLQCHQCCFCAPVQVRAPVEFQGTIFGDLNRRKGAIQNSDSEADEVVMQAQVHSEGASLKRHGVTNRALPECWHGVSACAEIVFAMQFLHGGSASVPCGLHRVSVLGERSICIVWLQCFVVYILAIIYLKIATQAVADASVTHVKVAGTHGMATCLTAQGAELSKRAASVRGCQAQAACGACRCR